MYRNYVNRSRKSLQAKYYSTNINLVKSQNQGVWWNDIKEIIGTKKQSNNGLLGLANKICNGDLGVLADEIHTAFQAVTVVAFVPATNIIFLANVSLTHYQNVKYVLIHT